MRITTCAATLGLLLAATVPDVAVAQKGRGGGGRGGGGNRAGGGFRVDGANIPRQAFNVPAANRAAARTAYYHGGGNLPRNNSVFFGDTGAFRNAYLGRNGFNNYGGYGMGYGYGGYNVYGGLGLGYGYPGVEIGRAHV